MKNLFKLAAVMALAVVLSACSSAGKYGGPARGVDLNVDGAMWGMGGGVTARSLTYGRDEKPLGTLTITQGAMDMTGPGVEIWARMMFCDKARTAAECTGGPATPSILNDDWPILPPIVSLDDAIPSIPDIPVTRIFD